MDAQTQEPIIEPDVREEIRQQGLETMRPRKEGRKGLKVHKRDEQTLPEEQEQIQQNLDELVLQSFRMSGPVFPNDVPAFSPITNMMTIAEAKRIKAWSLENRKRK